MARHRRVNELLWVVIHDFVPHVEESLGRQGFGEEIRFVVGASDEGDDNLQVLHALADEEVAPLHVLHPRVVLRVVGHRNRRLIIHVQMCRLVVAEAQIREERAQRNGLFGQRGMGNEGADERPPATVGRIWQQLERGAAT